MKTLHIIGSTSIGGAERSFSRIVAAMNRAGVVAEAVVRSSGTVSAILAPETKVYRLPLRTVWDPLSRLEVRRLIQTTKPDIVQTYMGRATRLTRLPSCKSPIHVARLCGHYQPRHFLHAHAFVACTHWVADYLMAAGIPAPKISIIPNFLPALPTATDDELEAARASWKLEDADLLVGAIGRLQWIKGFDVLIQAFSLLPERIDGRRVVLAIAGEGKLGSKLQEQAAALGVSGRVRLLGWTNRPDLLLRLADVVAFTSRPNEGFGNVTLEAWDAGTPLVTTRSKGAIETTRHLETAWQAPCEDALALSEGLLEVLRNEELASRLVESGRKELMTRYSENVVIGEFADLYARLTATI